MATDQIVKNFTVSGEVGADLSTAIYKAAKLTSDGWVVAGAGDSIDGIIYSNPGAAGHAVTIVLGGIAKAVLGGTVAPGDRVKVDSAGRFVTASDGDNVVGKCVEGGEADNIGSIKLGAHGKVAGGGVQSISTTGQTVDLSKDTVLLAISGTMAGTLPAGLYDGQHLEVLAVSAASTPEYTLAGDFRSGTTAGTSAVFNAAADKLRLTWVQAVAKWQVMENVSVTVS